MEAKKIQWTYLQNRNRLTDIENKLMVTKWERSGGGINWEFGIDIDTLLYLKQVTRASLVVQWLRICLPMQGTRVRALVWEDHTCRGATRPVSHNYWACTSGACAPQQERPRQWGPCTAMKSGPRSPQLEKALAQKRRPNTAKNK